MGPGALRRATPPAGPRGAAEAQSGQAEAGHARGGRIAREQAPAAAERAAKAIFAYNYQDMPADLARAKPYLTDSFAKEFTKNFHLLEKQADGTPGPAIETKTVVKSDVPATSVVDAEDGVVRVLAYVNLTSTRPGRDPQIFQNRVTMKMVKDGDRWLVDKVDTY